MITLCNQFLNFKTYLLTCRVMITPKLMTYWHNFEDIFLCNFYSSNVKFFIISLIRCWYCGVPRIVIVYYLEYDWSNHFQICHVVFKCVGFFCSNRWRIRFNLALIITGDSDTNLTVYNEPSICSKSSPSSASSTSTQSTTTQSPSSSTMSTRLTTVTTSVPAPVQLSCDFTDDYCGFSGDIKNGFLFSWMRSDGSKSGPQHRNSTTGMYAVEVTRSIISKSVASRPCAILLLMEQIWIHDGHQKRFKILKFWIVWDSVFI